MELEYAQRVTFAKRLVSYGGKLWAEYELGFGMRQVVIYDGNGVWHGLVLPNDWQKGGK